MFEQLAISLISFGLVYGDCNVNLVNITQDKQPLFLKSNYGKYSLWVEGGKSLKWDNSETTTIACSHPGNKISLVNSAFTDIKCEIQQNFIVNGASRHLNDLICSHFITGDIKNTGNSCARTGTVLEIGFEVQGLQFIPIIESCYNMDNASIIHTRHSLNGKAIEFAQVSSGRPSFKSKGSPNDVNFASIYTQASQMERFAELLGSEEEARKYIFPKSFLSKGHLAPDGDGVLTTWASATYFYTNVAPEWQIVNVGNWLRVENAARKIAGKLKEELDIYTGVHDTLRLPNKDGKLVKITLDPKGKVDVPKWFWKIIKSQKMNSAIALVTLNNPFASRDNCLCEDVCKKYGWHNSEYKDYRKGFTCCCTVEELKRKVRFVPDDANAFNVLRFN